MPNMGKVVPTTSSAVEGRCGAAFAAHLSSSLLLLIRVDLLLIYEHGLQTGHFRDRTIPSTMVRSDNPRDISGKGEASL